MQNSLCYGRHAALQPGRTDQKSNSEIWMKPGGCASGIDGPKIGLRRRCRQHLLPASGSIHRCQCVLPWRLSILCQTQSDCLRLSPAANQPLRDWAKNVSVPLRGREARGASEAISHGSINWIATLLSSVPFSKSSGIRLRYYSVRRRPRVWCFLDASRSTGMSRCLSAARDSLIDLATTSGHAAGIYCSCETTRSDGSLRKAAFARLPKFSPKSMMRAGKAISFNPFTLCIARF